MTLTTTTTEIEYTADGVATDYPLPFQFLANSNIVVRVNDAIVSSGYSVTGAGDDDGGTVIFDAPPGVGTPLKFNRILPLTQDFDPLDNSTIFASSVERLADVCRMIDQQLQTGQNDLGIAFSDLYAEFLALQQLVVNGVTINDLSILSDAFRTAIGIDFAGNYRELALTYSGAPVRAGLFTGSERAPQGGTSDIVAGVEKLWVRQRVLESPERFRIVQYTMPANGSAPVADLFSSAVFVSGHHGMGNYVEDGDRKFVMSGYSSGAPSPYETWEHRSVQIMDFEGAASGQADMRNYKLLDEDTAHWGSQFRIELTTCSRDGEFVFCGIQPLGNRVTVNNTSDFLVYRRSDIEAVAPVSAGANGGFADATAVDPVMRFSIHQEPSYDSFDIQDAEADDRYLYLLCGSTAGFARHYIQCYNYKTGQFVFSRAYDGPRARYPRATLLNRPDYGVINSMEPELITLNLESGLIRTGTQEIWSEPDLVVSYKGKNFAMIGTSYEAGLPPTYARAWVETTLAATDGEWDAEATYSTSGEVDTEIGLRIMTVGLARGLAGEYPMVTNRVNGQSAAPVHFGQRDYNSVVPVSSRHFRVGLFDEVLDEYRPFMSRLESSLRQYSADPRSDQGISVETVVQDYTEGGDKVSRCIFRIRDADNDNTGLVLYGIDDFEFPGRIKFYAGGADRWIIDPTEAWSWRPNADNAQDLGTLTRRIRKVIARNGRFDNLVSYADNAAAITAGLTAGELYRLGDGVGVVH